MELSWLLLACACVVAAATQVRLWRREELVARACHEVRGPLGAVALGLHGVERDGGGAGARVATLQLELERAALALDDLAGRGRGRLEELVDVAALLDLQSRCWDDVARARGGSVRIVAAPPRGRALVRGDRLRLAQALGNLLANAVEHGSGPVDVAARVTARLVRVEVADAGPGLPAPVTSLASRPRRGHGARGRGLAIASEVAARHGGRICSAPSTRGARVVLELPLAGR